MMARALTEEQLSIWKDRIARQAASGLRVADFCQQESISVGNFYYRKRQLMGRRPRPGRKVKSTLVDGATRPPASFVQVPLPASQGPAWIEIVRADGTLIRLPQQNMEAFELALAVCSSRSVDSK